MAERVRVELVDDIDGTSTATTQVHFEYGGRKYRIDLTDQHVSEMDAAMDKWIRHAREIGRNGKAVTKAKPASPKARNAEIRAWAAKKKLDVKPVGIIPKAVVEAYDAAHA